MILGGMGGGYKTQTTGVGLGELMSLGAEAGAARGSVAVVLSCEAMVCWFNISFCVDLKVERQGKAWREGVQSCTYNESSRVR